MKALTGADRPIQIAALKLLREINDRHVIQACLDQWTSLPVDAQLAVLDSQAKLGAEARPTARLAAQSPNALLRTAAWETLGALNDADSIPALAKAAAHAEPAESQAAREALARLDGPGVKDALLSQIAASAPPEKAELLRALGERGDRSVANVLLQNATSDVQPVRLAALGSLSKLAPPEAVLPCSTSPPERSPRKIATRHSRPFTPFTKPVQTRRKPPMASSMRWAGSGGPTASNPAAARRNCRRRCLERRANRQSRPGCGSSQGSRAGARAMA